MFQTLLYSESKQRGSKSIQALQEPCWYPGGYRSDQAQPKVLPDLTERLDPYPRLQHAAPWLCQPRRAAATATPRPGMGGQAKSSCSSRWPALPFLPLLQQKRKDSAIHHHPASSGLILPAAAKSRPILCRKERRGEQGYPAPPLLANRLLNYPRFLLTLLVTRSNNLLNWSLNQLQNQGCPIVPIFPTLPPKLHLYKI